MMPIIDDDIVRRAINKWESTAPIEVLLDINALKEHMIAEYGIKLTSTWNIVVVDEKKYTMFLLKFGS